jgi:hypothetical protein
MTDQPESVVLDAAASFAPVLKALAGVVVKTSWRGRSVRPAAAAGAVRPLEAPSLTGIGA